MDPTSNDSIKNEKSNLEISDKNEDEKVADTSVAGAVLIQFNCVLLIAMGLAELVAGSMVTYTSKSRFVGGIYVGLAGIFSGLRGLFLRHGTASVVGTLIFGVLALTVSLVGTALQAKMYSFLITLEACASPVPVPTTQCNTASPSYYQCYGEANYFQAAYLCARTENNYNTNSNDDSDTGFITCTCVTSSAIASNPVIATDDYLVTEDDAGTVKAIDSDPTQACYQYNEFRDCDTLLSLLPTRMQVSFLLSTLCVLLSSIVVLLCVLSLLRPQLFQYAKQPAPSPSRSNSDKGDKTAV